ncbi:MAG: RidA family protein [Opitutaceae bacterium]|nr:RidA family protein [Opitutaceae bacterium]
MMGAPLLRLAGLAAAGCSIAVGAAGAVIARAPLAGGTASSVRVADASLVFTGQIFARQPGGELRAEAEGALDALSARLRVARSALASVARLTVYATSDDAVRAAEAAIAARFAETPVALTVMRTPLPQAGARVAFEAVAVASLDAPRVSFLTADTAVLPAGAKLFISGQAERGADLAAACRATMAGLHRSCGHLGLAAIDIVQVKAFIRPFSDHAEATQAIAASFGGEPVPPIVVMEWVSDLFAEIEVVMSANRNAATAGGPVTHSWLPWLTQSPRYCHVARVPAGAPLIFLGAIDGGPGDARAQMKEIFARLGSALFDAGSSYRSLVKATYFLHDPAARTLLGSIRDVYFDPTRPPSASALQVAVPPRPGQAAAIDMIAVPIK